MLNSLLLPMLAMNTLYYSNSGWAVYDNGDDCSVIRSYQDDVTLWVSHEYRLNRTTFIIMDPAFKSVTRDKDYKLNLYFLKSEGLDDGWGVVNVSGFELDEGEKGVRFVLKGSDALGDLAESKTLALMRDDVVVESLSLTGSSAAVAQLRECSRKVERRNPSDPLAGAEIQK